MRELKFIRKIQVDRGNGIWSYEYIPNNPLSTTKQRISFLHNLLKEYKKQYKVIIDPDECSISIPEINFICKGKLVKQYLGGVC